MSYYDPFQRYNRGQRPAQGRQAQDPQRRQPTLEDYHQLVNAYQEAQKKQEEMAKQLATSQEALRQQTKTAIDLNEALIATKNALAEAQAQISSLSNRDEQAEGEWQERYLRLQAETENYRRRLEGRIAVEVAQQRNQILEDMLALADHLELALQHMDRPHEAQESATVEANFRQNLEATLRAFLETLKKHGVQPMEPMGKPFDPQIHEALGRVSHAELPEDHVAAVVRTGYLIDDQLLRPARVLVSSGVEA
ncbi:MAG: nucleotide exchange factor GrpE [Caldilineaceae bacterium]|nr:nucleotide exchange factor GrpE [Caldilineaceae bacterium]